MSITSPYWKQVATDVQSKYKPLKDTPCQKWKKKDIELFLIHLAEVVKKRCESKNELIAVLGGESYDITYYTFRNIFRVGGLGSVRTRNLFAIYLGYNNHHQYLEHHEIPYSEAFPEEEDSEKETPHIDHSKIPDYVKEALEHLKQRYTKRIGQKLAGRKPLNLKKLSSITGSSENISLTFKIKSGQEIRNDINQVFDMAEGRLLIIGEPGSGKSTLLLQLALALLDSDPRSITVILNLATWHKGFASLDDWIREILPSELQGDRTLANKTLKEYPITLLLDGFDEVKLEEREDCLKAIGFYGGKKDELQYVITSRINEYKEVAKDPIVHAQIEVCPLSIKQIETQLKEEDARTSRDAPFLLVALNVDKLLKQAVRTPLYFSMLRLLFMNGKFLNELNFSSQNVLGRQAEIKGKYIELSIELASKHYDKESTNKWLSFLANRMNQNNIVVFELIDLQYSWIKSTQKQQIIDGLIYGANIGILYCWPIGIVMGLLTNATYNLGGNITLCAICTFIALFYFTIMGGFVTILKNYTPPKITSKDKVSWSFRHKGKKPEFKKNIILGLKFGVVFGLIATMLFYYDYRNVLQSFVMLIFALILSIIWGLMNSISSSLGSKVRAEESSFLKINTPYQRFTASAWNIHFSYFRHWYLHSIISERDLLPTGLTDFLDVMTKNFLMESDDGESWRFRHKILQDHFAAMWSEKD